MSRTNRPMLAAIGFGEAATAFAIGWCANDHTAVAAYDIKTDSNDATVRQAKLDDYARHGIIAALSLADLLAESEIVFSLVTADQALAVATQAVEHVQPGTLYLDCNSCSPGSKRRAAEKIEAAGAHYVDAAVMAPVYPKLHRTPLLLSGPHAELAAHRLAPLDMDASIMPGEVGTSSSTKMIRSIMMKGLEGLVLECMLAGRRAGVDTQVLASLDATYPGFDWRKRSAYMLERATRHGIRRAAEMREVLKTVEELGLPPDMTRGTVAWEQRAGDLGLRFDEETCDTMTDAIDRALRSDV